MENKKCSSTSHAAALNYLKGAAAHISAAKQVLERNESSLSSVILLRTAHDILQQAVAVILADCLTQTVTAIHSSPAKELENVIDELAQLSDLILSQLCFDCRRQMSQHLTTDGPILAMKGKTNGD